MKYYSLFILLFSIFAASPALAKPDFDTAKSEEDRDYVCETTSKFAGMVVKYRDAGKSEEEVLKVTEEILTEDDHGWKTRHVWRTVIKGAYLHSEENQSEYSARVLLSCESNWTEDGEFKIH